MISIKFIKASSLYVQLHSRRFTLSWQLHISRLWKIPLQYWVGLGLFQWIIGMQTPASTAQSSSHLGEQKSVKKTPKLHKGGKVVRMYQCMGQNLERAKHYLGVRGKKTKWEKALQAPLAGGGRRFGSEGVMLSLGKMGFRGDLCLSQGKYILSDNTLN